jgi:hypothetical protein
MLFLTLSGFGQMPVFKRYYIADIPGFGWLARFFVTHHLHYLFAIMLLVLSAYALVDYFIYGKRRIMVTLSGYFRAGVIIGLVITGLLLVMRNLPGSAFSSGFIIFLDLAHLGLVMTLLGTGFLFVILKKRWVIEREPSE